MFNFLFQIYINITDQKVKFIKSHNDMIIFLFIDELATFIFVKKTNGRGTWYFCPKWRPEKKTRTKTTEHQTSIQIIKKKI